MSRNTLESVLELLDPPKGFSPWHGGPTLMGCLRGVKAEKAAWKPAPARHSIWELALHIAYWNHRVRSHLNPETERFERSPANWPEVGNPTDNQWKTDKSFIKKEHEILVENIRVFPENRLEETVGEKKKWTFGQLLDGIAAHETYHIAQIQLMKRLYESLRKK